MKGAGFCLGSREDHAGWSHTQLRHRRALFKQARDSDTAESDTRRLEKQLSCLPHFQFQSQKVPLPVRRSLRGLAPGQATKLHRSSVRTKSLKWDRCFVRVLHEFRKICPAGMVVKCDPRASQSRYWLLSVKGRWLLSRWLPLVRNVIWRAWCPAFLTGEVWLSKSGEKSLGVVFISYTPPWVPALGPGV